MKVFRGAGWTWTPIHKPVARYRASSSASCRLVEQPDENLDDGVRCRTESCPVYCKVANPRGWLDEEKRGSHLRLSYTISRESVSARVRENTSFFFSCLKILEWRRAAEWCFIVGHFFFIKLFSILPLVHSVRDIQGSVYICTYVRVYIHTGGGGNCFKLLLFPECYWKKLLQEEDEWLAECHQFARVWYLPWVQQHVCI